MNELNSKLVSPRSASSEPATQKKFDFQTQDSSSKMPLVSQFQFADTFEIIKTDSTVLYSYQTHSHLQLETLKQIRKQIIQYSRKLTLEAYVNDVTEKLIKGFYVCFRVKQGIIFYVIACSSYSYSNAEQIINAMICTFDQVLIKIFGQPKLPKNINKNYQTKFILQMEKIKQPLKRIGYFAKSTLIASKSQKFLRTIQDNFQMVDDSSRKILKIKPSFEQILQKSLSLKQQSRRLTIWIACKKYLIFIFLIACFMIACYLFSNYY